jgi:hypothetical protein
MRRAAAVEEEEEAPHIRLYLYIQSSIDER